jgi:hypothetical protein
MTQEDVIRMAREAGAMFEHIKWVERDLQPVFQRFAALVAAAEREACADICDQHATCEGTAQLCADAIRARG